MKKLLLIFALVWSTQVFSQESFKTSQGEIIFYTNQSIYFDSTNNVFHYQELSIKVTSKKHTLTSKDNYWEFESDDYSIVWDIKHKNLLIKQK